MFQLRVRSDTENISPSGYWGYLDAGGEERKKKNEVMSMETDEKMREKMHTEEREVERNGRAVSREKYE